MSKKLSIESLTKKLKNVANTQDSIPMFSLWIIHHKAHYELIVNTWLEILKTSTPKHRLTLWYLANDVIQSCGRKKADVFKDYFANILPEAIAFLRDKTILPGVERVLNVWSSRNVYDTEIIDQLHAALLTNRPPDKLRQKLLAEYKPSVLVDSIAAFKKREDIVLFDEKHLKNVRVDASCSDDIHKLKDKVGGEIFSRNFEESAMNIERFMSEYEKYVEERKKLVDSLTQGAVFYRAQYHEAKIVVNAYQSFEARVSKMKKLLDQVKLKFSPKTPPLESSPINDVDDMDMSDSDQELGNKPSKIVAVDTNTRQHTPVRPITVVTSTATPVSTKPAAPQQSGMFINRPGMRGASTSVSIFKQQEISTPRTVADITTPTKINFPVSFNGTVKPGYDSKVSTPSASPPSPEGSPELNISSPPRHQSLESRLADLFNSDSKVDISTGRDNTASESDADSITDVPPTKSSPLKEENEALLNASANDSDDRQILVPESRSEDVIRSSPPPAVTMTHSSWQNDAAVSIATTVENDSSWQNTIPVIGGSGNRHAARSQNRSFMGNLHLVLDGSSTPLQDEILSEGENFDDTKTPPAQPNPLLPPPSFSGDALNFLTKFMGQKTNTLLSQPIDQPESQWDSAITTTATQPITTTTGKDILRNLGIDWNSIQNITNSVNAQSSNLTWPKQDSVDSVTNSEQEQNQSSQMSDHDTDYRMAKSGNHQPIVNDDVSNSYTGENEIKYFTESLKEVGRDNLLDLTPTSTPEPANQFIDILRQKSSEQTPSFAPTSNDVIVEEEEILVEEDNSNNINKMRNSKPQEQLYDQNNVNYDDPDFIPHNFKEYGQPPRSTGSNISGMKRHMENPMIRADFSDDINFEPMVRPSFQPRPLPPLRPRNAFGPDYRLPLRGNFRPRGPHINERIRMRPPMRRTPGPRNSNHDVDFRSQPRQPHPAMLKEEYYDRLYDELQPKFRRGENMPGRFMNRMPYH